MFEEFFAGLRSMMSGRTPPVEQRPEPPKAKVGRPDRGDRSKVKAGRKAARARR